MAATASHGSKRKRARAGARPPRASGMRKDWLKRIAARFEPREQYLIPILQFIQTEAGYLPPEAMRAAARHLRLSEAKIYGVASFYAQFHFEPRGRHKVTICRGTACHVRGSARLLTDMEHQLGIKAGGTTEDLSFTLETVACFGACALAPVAVIDGKVHGRQSSESLKKAVAAAAGHRSARSPKGKSRRRSR